MEGSSKQHSKSEKGTVYRSGRFVAATSLMVLFKHGLVGICLGIKRNMFPSRHLFSPASTAKGYFLQGEFPFIGLWGWKQIVDFVVLPMLPAKR